jgi:hypothetical protein
MAAPSLDNEFLQYWMRLSAVEKESLLSVAKNYVQLKESDEEITSARNKLILAEREAYYRGEGKNFDWEQVKELARNRDRRNEL